MKDPLLDRLSSEIREGIALPKCLVCGCMRDALDALSEAMPELDEDDRVLLAEELSGWQAQLKEQKYSCAGCAHCYGAVASNALQDLLDGVAPATTPAGVKASQPTWPPVPGEYIVVCDEARCTVAVSTLASEGLAEAIASVKPPGLAIVGKTETENIGIDKIIKNTITNPSIRFLVLAGDESEGHYSGQTLAALVANGVDDRMRVTGSQGRRPVLKNVTLDEVEAFRSQVQVVDMIGVGDVDLIVDRMFELAMEPPAKGSTSCSCDTPRTVAVEPPVRIVAEEPTADVLDKAGYFVVVPDPKEGKIIVEHYGYDDRLLHTVEGTDARSIYFTAIRNGWVTQLSHSAYLGKELEKAELSMRHGFRYVQDGM